MNKNTRVFYGDKEIMWKNQYAKISTLKAFKIKAKKFIRYALKVITIGSIASGVMCGVFFAGSYMNPKTVYAIEQQKISVNPITPVLDRIAGCESGNGAKSTGSQYAKSGQVLLHANKDGSVDIGQYQINNVTWASKATALGYNLFTQAGHESMAKYIYQIYGTGSWSSSEKCWQ